MGITPNLYPDGALELPPGDYVLFLVTGTADTPDRGAVWIIQLVAARLDTLADDATELLAAVRMDTLARFVSAGASWREGVEVRAVGLVVWPRERSG